MVSIVGNTLSQLVTAIAGELGPAQQFTATASSVNETTVVSSAMADSEAPTEKFGGYYLYALTGGPAGQERRVKRNGFTGASGTFTVATAYANTPPDEGQWLLGGTMPVIDQDGLTGIRTCINRAIRKLWYRHWYPFTAVASQDEYDLGALWWATRSRFVRLMDPDLGGTGHPIPATQSWDVIQNADTWTLQLTAAYPADETFWLIVEAPTNFRLKQTGTWTNQASPVAGLSSLDDACLGEFNHVVQCSLYECFKQLALQAGGNRKSYWAGRVNEQRVIVSAIKGYMLDDDGRTMGEGPTNAVAGHAVGDRGFFSGGY